MGNEYKLIVVVRGDMQMYFWTNRQFWRVDSEVVSTLLLAGMPVP